MAKHEKTLAALFASPIRRNVAWTDLLSLLSHLGATITTDAGGSMHNVTLGGSVIVLQKPCPQKEISPAMVRRVRQFLNGAGVRP